MLRLRHAVLLALAALPAAAEEPGRWELTAFAGSSLLDSERRITPDVQILIYPPVHVEQHVSLGTSPQLGFKLGRYLTDRAALELELAVAPSQRAVQESRYSCLPEYGCPYRGLPNDTAPAGVVPPDQPISSRFFPDYRFEEQVATWQYALGFSYDLTGGGARPYVGASLGGATYDRVYDSQTDLRFGVLAGVKLGSGRTRGRLELVDFVSSDHFLTRRTEHDLQVRAALSVRLP